MPKHSYHKFFSAAIAATVATAAAVAAPETHAEAKSFPDVKSTDYFYEAVKSLTERGIISGFPDGTFKPGKSVTRAQAAKILAGVLGLDTKNVKNPGFKDVGTSNEYYGAIAALANAGVISGYPDKTFKPNEPIQRNHMAKIIARAFQLEASSKTKLPFKDVSKDYEKYIKALYEYNITTGTTPDTFGGNANVNRGQLAAFVVRAENVEFETTFTITDISGNTVYAGDKRYIVPSGLQGFFSTANKPVLKGAQVKAKIKKGQIVSISSFALSNSGIQQLYRVIPLAKVNGKYQDFTLGYMNGHFVGLYSELKVSKGDKIELVAANDLTIYYELATAEELAQGKYRIATKDSARYKEPIPINASTYLHAIAVKDGKTVGEIKAPITVLTSGSAQNVNTATEQGAKGGENAIGNTVKVSGAEAGANAGNAAAGQNNQATSGTITSSGFNLKLSGDGDKVKVRISSSENIPLSDQIVIKVNDQVYTAEQLASNNPNEIVLEIPKDGQLQSLSISFKYLDAEKIMKTIVFPKIELPFFSFGGK